MKAIFVLISIFVIYETSQSRLKRSFSIDFENNCFLKDGSPFRYISGSMHYFRIPKLYWNDSMKKAKSMGLNTIQSYIAWNIHEINEGHYDFKDDKDIINFINLAQQNDLLVILRPGPYIDAEWEFGGFPWWMAKSNMTMRTSGDKSYMKYVSNWFSILLPMIKQYLYKNGGPIIAVQVENEYGNYYACDHEYMKELKNLFQLHLGNDVVLFTTDGYTDDYLKCGTIPSLFTTIDFGTEISAEEAFKLLRNYQKKGPLVNSEFYTGWLDYWGKNHQKRNARNIALHLDEILKLNASVNLYMFQGGTNFGYMNGADMSDSQFLISPTSYDYDAPISEAGDLQAKFFSIRNVIQKYTDFPLPPVPIPSVKMAYGKVFMKSFTNLNQAINLFHLISRPVHFKNPLRFEEANLGYGFMLYQTELHDANVNNYLEIEEVNDRSTIYVDGVKQGCASRGQVALNITKGKTLEILVENQGRLAYATKGVKYLPDVKGILSEVRINQKIVNEWLMFRINDSVVNYLQKMNKSTTKQNSTGLFFFSSFFIEKISDTYIKMNGWKKGQIYINNYNIGRYWSIGPQQTLYIPKSFLKKKKNTVTIFELDEAPCLLSKIRQCFIEFVDKPILG
ncbi:beta-galactosidase isoform X2 [Hydra vulgaris]|uniref:Beta-galactosidase n=1 Tax=Hydra vulgaris TaxID=6087 RepID=A0ABM4CZA0_HYDVU